MARIIAYQSTTPATDDLLLGTQKTTSGTNKTNPTKNFTVDSVVQAGLGYTVYTALLTQTGTGAPVATILKNNTGATFTWARTGSGTYTITASGNVFTNNKTIVFVNQGGALEGLVTWARTSDTITTIQTFNGGLGGAAALADSILGFGGAGSFEISMAIIYSYPQINLSSISADDLMIISDMNADGRPTKSLTLKNLADFVTSTGTGTGTTNKIIKWSDGPAGLIGDSIMNEDVDKIYVDGQLRIGSSSGASRIQIFHDVLNSDTTFSSGGATGSQIIGRRNELYIENCGASRGDIIFKANNGEDNGSTETYFLLDASMADIGTSAKYTRWPDQSRIVLGNSSNVNSLDFEMYHDGSGTALQNGASGLSIRSKGGIFIENETGGEIEIHNNRNSDFNIRSEGDIKLKGSGGVEYFRVDSGVGEAIFYKQAQVPLIPTANTHATSKQYVDTQIASIPAGLVFKSIGCRYCR
jgi:hypothetical protein